MNVTTSLHTNGQDQFRLWDPSSLKKVSSDKISYVNSFIGSKPESLCPGFRSCWTHFFKSLDMLLPDITVECTKGVSQYITTSYSFLVDSQEGFILLSSETEKKLGEIFCPGNIGSLDELSLSGSYKVFIEYVIMRFLWSIKTSWYSDTKLPIIFTGESAVPDYIEYPGDCLKININFNSDSSIVIESLLPANVVSIISSESDSSLVFRSFSAATVDSPQVRFTCELFRFNINPSELIEYLRSGSVIKTNLKEIGNSLSILINQKEEAEARLMYTDGKFLLSFKRSEKERSVKPSGETEISVAIVDESSDVSELSTSSLFYLTNTNLTPKVSLLIGGEVVANGELGYIEGDVAIKVLPR